jgi:hypothetical protein
MKQGDLPMTKKKAIKRSIEKAITLKKIIRQLEKLEKRGAKLQCASVQGDTQLIDITTQMDKLHRFGPGLTTSIYTLRILTPPKRSRK